MESRGSCEAAAFSAFLEGSCHLLFSQPALETSVGALEPAGGLGTLVSVLAPALLGALLSSLKPQRPSPTEARAHWRPKASSRVHPQEPGGHSARTRDTQEAASACSHCLSPRDHHTQAEVFFPPEFLDEESFFHEILLFSLKCFIPFFNSSMKNPAQGQGQQHFTSLVQPESFHSVSHSSHLALAQ